MGSQLILRVGYYIHNCVKMRYKAAFWPQYILGALSNVSIRNMI